MSATHSVAPAPDSGDREKPREDTFTLKVLGAEIPLPHWAISIIAVFVIVAFPVFLFVSLRHIGEDQKAAKELDQQIVALKQQYQDQIKANADLLKAKDKLQATQEKLIAANDNYLEVQRHKNDKTGEEYHRDSDLIVTHYASDGCVSVVRTGAADPQWNKDPARLQETGPAPGAVDGGKRGELVDPGQPGPPKPAATLRPGWSFATAQVRLLNLNGGPQNESNFVPVQYPSGRCLNPHPGQFQSWNGRTQGCWIQVWRKWADGCTHYQWFNACSSYWDADRRGQPVVYWTACRH